MSDLDLSFVTTKGAIDKPVASGALDLSFADSPKLSAAQTAQRITAAQDAGEFPQGAREGWMPSMNTVTGNDRETNATRKLPELGTEMGIGEFLGMDVTPSIGRDGALSSTGDIKGLPVSAAVITAMNPVEIVQILQEKAGDKLTVRPDEAGNIILGLDGREAILNKPGFTAFDAMQVGGLMAAFSPSSATATAPTIMRNMGRVGAAMGLTQAAIEQGQKSQGGEFNTGDIALTAGTGAAFQGAFQRLAQSLPWLRQKIKDSPITDEIRSIYQKTAVRLGMSADDVTDDMIRASVDDAARAVTPEEGLALSGEREFRVPLTQGQRTLDDAQLSLEDRARVGLSGRGAQRVVQGFDDEVQKPAVNQAREMVETRIAGDAIPSPGGVIKEGVRNAERQADELVGAAYDSVPDAQLTTDGVVGLFKATRKAVTGIEFDRNLPQTATLLKMVRSFEKLVSRSKTGEGLSLKPLDVRTLEQYRRRLNTAAGSAEGSDLRQVMLMKRGFDDYMDTAVQNALFSGDDAAISSLKAARGLFSDYAKKFRAQPIRGKSGKVVDRDQAGAFIEKLVDADPTDEQVVNAIFGASGLNNKSGVALASRFREILGADSEGWAAVRRAALGRIIQTTRDGKGVEYVSGAKTLTAIDKAMESNGTLMKEVFSADEISLLRRFGAHVKRTQAAPTRSRENPSGTAQVAGKALVDTFQKMGAAFAITGNPVLALTSTGVQVGKAWTSTGKAASSVRPFSQLQSVKPGVVAGAQALEQKR